MKITWRRWFPRVAPSHDAGLQKEAADVVWSPLTCSGRDVSVSIGERGEGFANPSDAFVCPVCAGQATPRFSLWVSDGPLQGRPKRRMILECSPCGFQYTRCPSPDECLVYYQQLRDDYFSEHDLTLYRYHVVQQVLGQRGGDILDIGCGQGTFLSTLPGSFRKYGVEPARQLAASAEKSGICILGNRIEGVAEKYACFDYITVIDVIEHLPDPFAFVRRAATMLRPGGQLILVTGDSSRIIPRFLGAYWYYYHYAEHVSFFSEKSVRALLALDFGSTRRIPFTHQGWSVEMLGRLLFGLAAVFAKKLLGLAGVFRYRYKSLAIPAFADHMLIQAVRQ